MRGSASFLGPVTGIGCFPGTSFSGDGVGHCILGVQALNESMGLDLACSDGIRDIKILNRLQHQRILQCIKRSNFRPGRRFRGRLVTWNSHGGFGGLGFSNPEQAKLKHSVLRRCCDMADILMIQETHASDGEIQLFLESLHGAFLCVQSCAQVRAQGGVAIFIRITWIQQFSFIWCTILQKGRAINLSVVDEYGCISTNNNRCMLA